MKVTKKVSPSGNIEYFNEHDNLHREDGPAMILSNGFEAWFINGKRHREDGPAVIWPYGLKGYWLNDKQYSYEEWFDRVTNPIKYKWREYCVTKTVHPIGNIVYENEHGEYHRVNGPAIIKQNGYKSWYINGYLHREDGPAVIYPDGTEFYCLKGKPYSYEEWKELTKDPISRKWREYCHG